MMRRSRRTAVYAVVTGLLTAGALTATMSAAHANVAGFCNGSGAAATCTDTQTMTAPTSVAVAVRATVNGIATVSWKATCSLNGQTVSTSGGAASETPVTDTLVLPFTDPASCTVSATVTLPTSDSTNSLSVAMTYTTGASPSPSPTPSPTPAAYHPWQGYDSKCLDDAGNSSALRAKVQIWTCGGSDKAQYWSYTSGELQHNGLCLNDQRGGGDGSHAILYTCNGAANEIWTHLANGELQLKANGGKYCLDDPAYSTTSGTQLILYSCKDSSNQRWSERL
jgi:hypothetical protein